MKRIAILFVLWSLVLSAVPASAASCRVAWGSLSTASAGATAGEVVALRAGRHACFDRLVLDVDSRLRGYDVRYVEQVRRADDGRVVPLRGGARLAVTARADVLATDAWFLPNGELLDPAGFRTFRHLAWAGSDGSATTVGLGVRARLPFRVLVLAGPGAGSRLVVDVAHRW